MADQKTEVAPMPNAREERAANWSTFEADIKARTDEIASQLPSNVPRDRFVNAAIAAVKATPELLTATPRSLMSAVIKAAQDGLLPDGREGIITVYSQKVRDSNPVRYENVAQWNPMFYGIRKRARELDEIIIDAQVVVEGDEFEFELGDTPRIRHVPKARAEAVDASKGVAVYAIFRKGDAILHREVMWKPEVFATMNQSRAKGSLMWTTFWSEGWKKACGRRASKSVPVSPALERVITRDDEHFDFKPVAVARPSMPAIPDSAPAIPDKAAPTIEHQPQIAMPPIADKAEVARPKAEAPQQVAEEVDEDDPWSTATRPAVTVPPSFAGEADTSDEGRMLSALDGTLATARDIETLERLWDQSDVLEAFSDDPPNAARAAAIYTKHQHRIERAALEAAGRGGLNFD